MKNTKELRKQFADAIMDGRFDDILGDHMKPEEHIERSQELHIAKDIIENVLKGSCGANGALMEFGCNPNMTGEPIGYNKWQIHQDMFRVHITLEEIGKW
tara:strand:+ start:51383 stop:51682 length:300 start_codon:yes stop_codon:yes gene_type:complete